MLYLWAELPLIAPALIWLCWLCLLMTSCSVCFLHWRRRKGGKAVISSHNCPAASQIFNVLMECQGKKTNVILRIINDSVEGGAGMWVNSAMNTDRFFRSFTLASKLVHSVSIFILSINELPQRRGVSAWSSIKKGSSGGNSKRK